MIEARHLTKRYGHTVAVDEASFVVRPGRVAGRGRIIADASTEEFVNRNATPSVRVRAVAQADLADALSRRGALLEGGPGGALIVTGLDAAAIGAVACAHDIALVELATHSATLEEAFFDLTRDQTDCRAGQLAGSSRGN